MFGFWLGAVGFHLVYRGFGTHSMARVRHGRFWVLAFGLYSMGWRKEGERQKACRSWVGCFYDCDDRYGYPHSLMIDTVMQSSGTDPFLSRLVSYLGSSLYSIFPPTCTNLSTRAGAQIYRPSTVQVTQDVLHLVIPQASYPTEWLGNSTAYSTDRTGLRAVYTSGSGRACDDESR